MSVFLSRRNLLKAGAAGAVVGSAGMGGLAAAEVAAKTAPAVKLGPTKGMARLQSNENPYGPSEKAQKAIAYAGEMGAYYAGAANMQLAEMIAERNGITPEHIALSTGSAEVLCAAALAYGKKGKIVAPALFFDPTVRYAERKGATIVRAPMGPDLSVDLDALEAMVDDETALVQICNPNNPTGELIDADALRAFTKRVSKKTTVLIDEAYNEITDDSDTNSMVDLVRDGHDVIVARTFSKIYGMAGIRLGYTMAAPETSAMLRDHVMSWVSGPALAGAIACYEDPAFMSFSRAKIVEARDMVSTALAENDLEALPSATNFMFVKLPGDANVFRDKMAEQGVSIRGVYGDHVHYSRVSMGFIKDVEKYCNALPKALEA
ncbi:histidinol-phosphate aminotransferase [Parvularcula bermudensis HTCC2503]|uniref:histidinol-phosphate transaminase n=1 Tax=Parvularcula bermudensis (strain ATCC BAA-594 / HTCC2503 / KCTC 12087) TaxID=314260 RepID=E0TBE9_PARBH|nr:histidinol-phosphate transaminase [Parvularcula bermudensis]ADM09746.1 histidinol-phosphate aminotransferase [Parvularcula bermudensis HTCC2503]